MYNNKEFEKEGGVYFYGARLYAPVIGRFGGVDPIAEKFPHLSIYNYASNDPIKNIDLHGLQGIPAKVSAFGKFIESKVNKFLNSSPIKASEETVRRTKLGLNEAKNLALGTIGTFGAVVTAPETNGATAAAIPLTLGEAGVGLTQLVDAVVGNADQKAVLHNIETPVGLVAGEAGVEGDALKLIDGGTQVLTMALGSPNGNIIAAGMDEVASGTTALLKGDVGTAVVKAMSVQDAIGDVSSTLKAGVSVVNKASIPFIKEQVVTDWLNPLR